MKRLDKLLLNIFVTQFLLILAVIVFILTIQAFFLCFEEIAGKGLGGTVYARLLFYIGGSMLKDAFPLAILLAALIVFGALGENSELVAIKAAGIPLVRIVRPLFLLVALLSVVLFLLSAYITPRMQRKMITLIYDIQQKKPALLIKEGTFCNNIPGYSIKVDKKLPDGKSLEGVIIYDHTKDGQYITTVADAGLLYTVEAEKKIILELFNGHNYIESATKGRGDKKKNAFYRTNFSQQNMTISLAALELSNTGESAFSHLPRTKLNPELSQWLIREKSDFIKNQTVACSQLTKRLFPLYNTDDVVKPPLVDKKMTILQLKAYLSADSSVIKKNNVFSTNEKLPDSVREVINDAMTIQSKLVTQKERAAVQQRYINQHEYEKHHRVALAVMCIIMFLIGAPLGVIVKKGGLGIPLLLASFFIMIHYIAEMFSKQWALNAIVGTFEGAWIANFILFPLCCFFLWQAHRGASLFEIDYYAMLWKKTKDNLCKPLQLFRR